MQDLAITVDPGDEWLLREYHWSLTRRGSGIHYVIGRVKGSVVLLHRVIADAPIGTIVDHANGNGLDNRRCNLRLTDQSHNIANGRMRRNNTSGYKGVLFNKRSGRWGGYIKRNGKQLWLGTFATPEDAARAYDRRAIDIYGEFALTNEMLGLYPGQLFADLGI